MDLTTYCWLPKQRSSPPGYTTLEGMKTSGDRSKDWYSGTDAGEDRSGWDIFVGKSQNTCEILTGKEDTVCGINVEKNCGITAYAGDNPSACGNQDGSSCTCCTTAENNCNECGKNLTTTRFRQTEDLFRTGRSCINSIKNLAHSSTIRLDKFTGAQNKVPIVSAQYLKSHNRRSFTYQFFLLSIILRYYQIYKSAFIIGLKSCKVVCYYGLWNMHKRLKLLQFSAKRDYRSSRESTMNTKAMRAASAVTLNRKLSEFLLTAIIICTVAR